MADTFQMRVKKLRKSGLRILDDMPWGQHVSLFYETKQDLFDIVVPYLKAGLESNELCLWVISEPITRKEATAALLRAVPALARHIAEHRLEVHSARKWYRTGGRLDLQKAATAWDAKLAVASARGYGGVRLAASVTRLKAKEWTEFLEYEDRLNGLLSGKAILVLCAYPLAALRAADLVSAARTHRSVVLKRAGEWKAL